MEPRTVPSDWKRIVRKTWIGRAHSVRLIPTVRNVLGMKVLFCGDIVGRAGRDAVIKEVPRLRRELGLDFVAVHSENAAAGLRNTAQICAQLHQGRPPSLTPTTHALDPPPI